MSTGKKLRLLCADGDREALQPILQALTARGLRIARTGDPGKRDLVLAVLSEKLYAEPQKTEALLSLVGAGAENVLPLQLDKAAIPEDLKRPSTPGTSSPPPGGTRSKSPSGSPGRSRRRRPSCPGS